MSQEFQIQYNQHLTTCLYLKHTKKKNFSLILSTNPIGLASTETYCVISTANPPTLHFIEINSTAPSIKQEDTNASPFCTNFAGISS